MSTKNGKGAIVAKTMVAARAIGAADTIAELAEAASEAVGISNVTLGLARLTRDDTKTDFIPFTLLATPTLIKVTSIDAGGQRLLRAAAAAGKSTVGEWLIASDGRVASPDLVKQRIVDLMEDTENADDLGALRFISIIDDSDRLPRGLAFKEGPALDVRSNVGFLPNWPHRSVYPGLHMIVGGTGSGKSTHIFAELGVDLVVRLIEPHPEHLFVEYPDVAVYLASSMMEAIVVAAIAASAGQRVALDGLRSLVFNSTGGTLKGGISAPLFDDVTQLNNLLSAIGISVIGTLNPLIETSAEADLVRKLAASCSTILYINGNRDKSVSGRFTDGRSMNLTEPVETVSEAARVTELIPVPDDLTINLSAPKRGRISEDSFDNSGDASSPQTLVREEKRVSRRDFNIL